MTIKSAPIFGLCVSVALASCILISPWNDHSSPSETSNVANASITASELRKLQSAQLLSSADAPHNQSTLDASADRSNRDTFEFRPDSPPAALNSLSDVIDHLETTAPDEFDLDGIVRQMNDSRAVFNYVSDAYFSSTRPEAKQMLLKALENSSHPAKTSLALDLARSSELAERRKAYSWLSRDRFALNDRVVQTLFIDAISAEQDEQVLALLVSSLPPYSALRNAEISQQAMLSLKELVYHPNDLVAAQAITKLSSLAPNQDSLNVVQTYLHGESETLQMAALESLRYFDSANSEIMTKLELILNDASLAQSHRSVAAKALIIFENDRG